MRLGDAYLRFQEPVEAHMGCVSTSQSHFLALGQADLFPYATRTKNNASKSILRRFARMAGIRMYQKETKGLKTA